VRAVVFLRSPLRRLPLAVRPRSESAACLVRVG